MSIPYMFSSQGLRRRAAALAAALVFSAFPAWGAEEHHGELSPDPALSLSQVVEAALALDPERGLAPAMAREAQALQHQAGSLLAGNPALLLSHTTDQVGTGQGRREWQTGLDLPLWWPGQKSARREVADRVEGRAAASGELLIWQVAGVVREGLWTVALSQTQLALAQEGLDTATALEHDVQRRVELGDLARADLLLAHNETLGREADLLQARTEAKHAQVNFRIFTGLDRIPADFNEPLHDAEEVPDTHPLLVEANAVLDEAQSRLRLAREERAENPSLTVGSRHERDMQGVGYVNSLGLAVRVPIGTSAQSEVKRATAGRGLAQALSQRDRVRRELEMSLHEAKHGLFSLREALKLAESQNALAKERLRLARTAFDAGETDLVDLLRVRSSAFTAEQTERLRRLELQRAIARVNQALGVLP